MRVIYYNQKKERFIQKNGRVLLFIVAGVMAVWSFFWLPYFKIKEIEINDPLVSKREVEEELGLSLSSITRLFLPQNNFFLFPSKMAEEAILESGLGVAEIEKKFPNKIFVEFKEIKPKFLYCDKLSESEVEPPYGGSTSIDCYYIDKDGVAYESAPFFSDSPLPVINLTPQPPLRSSERREEKNNATSSPPPLTVRGGGPPTGGGGGVTLGEAILPQNEAQFLLNFSAEIKRLGLSIKKITIENDVKITTSEGWYLALASGEKDYKEITEKLSILFERKIKNRSRLEYIDMRFPNKAFYKLSP